MRKLLVAVLLATLSGCTSITVKSVAWTPDTGRRICVKENYRTETKVGPVLDELLSGVSS